MGIHGIQGLEMPSCSGDHGTILQAQPPPPQHPRVVLTPTSSCITELHQARLLPSATKRIDPVAGLWPVPRR